MKWKLKSDDAYIETTEASNAHIVLVIKQICKG